eukprot:scaffold2815_cov113-Isochrysis_galbana.AAC.15
MQSNRKNAVEHEHEHAGEARSQTKRTPNLRRKKRQIAVDSSEILQNWTAILRFVENSTEILRNGLLFTHNRTLRSIDSKGAITSARPRVRSGARERPPGALPTARAKPPTVVHARSSSH